MRIKVVFIDGSQILFDYVIDVRFIEESNTAIVTIEDANIPTLININAIKYLEEI